MSSEPGSGLAALARGIPLAEEPGLGGLTLPSFLREVTQAWPGNEALVLHQADGFVERWTYTELWQRSNRIAQALVASGVGKGTPVGILMTNRPEWIAACFGIALAGGVVVGLSTFSTPTELEYLLKRSAVSVLLFERRVLAKDFNSILKGLVPEAEASAPGELQSEAFPFLRHMVELGSGDAIGRGAVETWADFLSRADGINPGIVAARAKQVAPHGAIITLSEFNGGIRPFRSGAFASARSFEHGRFEAEIKAARGSGLITGFFLHRECPRQEIDVELLGDNPRHMLVNVYFNPGDEGAAMGFGYRGSPYRVDLDFDASEGYHLYTVDWRPDAIIWSVDRRIVHQRASWDPTPIPHLPMRLHANLWAPRSEELAGRIDTDSLPAEAHFRNVSVRV